MPSRYRIMFGATLAMLAFVCHAATVSDANDGRVTTHAITIGANGDDTASIPDFDGDGTIGFGDFLIFAGVFGQSLGDEKYDARVDLNGDGEIGFSDFVIFAQNFGKDVPSPVVTIPDANLRTAIEAALDKATGAPITQADIATLDSLEASDADISDLTGLGFAVNLTWLDLATNNITDISVLEGLTNLTHLALSSNDIADLASLVANTGLGTGDTVDLTDNPLNVTSQDTHIPSLRARGVSISFIAPAVTIPDANLRAAIEAALDKASGAPITRAEIATLDSLEANDADISLLTGLEYAVNLTYLSLNDNNITNISALGKSTNLERLWLSNNRIEDISALAKLTNLTELWLWNNQIEDISALSGLTNLTRLSLGRNNITDISALSGLINLRMLILQRNRISDLTPLAANKGLGTGVTVDVTNNPLNAGSQSTYIPALQARGVNVSFVPPVECTTNLIVRPGGSCRYPGSERLFSISSTGEMSFWFFVSKVGINIDISSSDGVRYMLLARNRGDGSWLINGVARSYTGRIPAAEECRVGMVVRVGESCRYPGTEVLFQPTGTGDGAALDHWGPGVPLPHYILHARPHGFLRMSSSDVQIAAERSPDQTWIVRRVGNSPPSPFACAVGMHVLPGGSCVYPGTMIEFSVDQNSRGSFQDVSEPTQIEVNTNEVNFAAKNYDGFVWTITKSPTVVSNVPTAYTECRANMTLGDGNACRYPDTNHTFWVSPDGSGYFDSVQYEYSMVIDAPGVVFRAHTLGATRWIIAKVGNTSNTPPPPEMRTLVDRPDDFSGPQIHVVYAVASDGEDLQLDRPPSSPEFRLLTYKSDGRVSIHRSFEAIQTWLSEQIGQQLRLDTYGSELDVSFVRLPFTEREIAVDPGAMLDRIATVVRQRTGTSKAIAIVYHGLEISALIGGIAGIGSDRALLLMGGFIEVTQYGGGTLHGPDSVDLVMVHEIFHMLGAVPICESRGQGRSEAEFCTLSTHHVSDTRDIMGTNNTGTAQIDPDRNDYYGHGYPDCTDISKSVYFVPSR